MGTGVVDGHGSGGQNNGSFKFALVQISAEPRAPKTLKTFQHKIPPVSGALLIMSSRSEKKVVASCGGNMPVPQGKSLNYLADRLRGSRSRDLDGRLVGVYNAKCSKTLRVRRDLVNWREQTVGKRTCIYIVPF